MIYGYARVSTASQMKGNSLDEQQSRLKELGCNEIVVEQFSAKTNDRPLLNELIAKLKAGDTLIVTKLDRLSRTATEGKDLIMNLIERDVVVMVDNMGTISNRPMDKLVLTMLLAFAEFERDTIIERMQSGRQYARENIAGYKDGMKKKIKQANLDNAMKLLDDGITYTKVVEMTGISKSTLIREKKDRRNKAIQQ